MRREVLFARRAPGDGALAQRHRELARVEGDALVLGQLEAQRRRPAGARRALDDVDAAGVGPGDEAALLEDDAEQLVDVAHRRHRARDVEQLAELVAVAPQRAAARLGPALRLEQLERAVRRQIEVLAVRVRLDDARQALVDRVSEAGRRGSSDEHEQRRPVGEPIGERREQLAPPVPHRGRREDDADPILGSPVRRDGNPPRRDEQRVRARDGVAREARVAPEPLLDAIHREGRTGCGRRTRSGVAHPRSRGSAAVAALTYRPRDRARRRRLSSERCKGRTTNNGSARTLRRGAIRRSGWRACATTRSRPCARRERRGARGAGPCGGSRSAGRPTRGATSSLGASEKQLTTPSARSFSQNARSTPAVASFSASVRGDCRSSRKALLKHSCDSVEAWSSKPPRAVATKYRRSTSLPKGSKPVSARPLRSAAVTALRVSASVAGAIFAYGSATPAVLEAALGRSDRALHPLLRRRQRRGRGRHRQAHLALRRGSLRGRWPRPRLRPGVAEHPSKNASLRL